MKPPRDPPNIRQKNNQGQNNNQRRPEHYALLDEMQESRSSRDSDKMIQKDAIKMVDSWMMVENKQESDNSRNPHHNHQQRVSLEESIILRVPNQRR